MSLVRKEDRSSLSKLDLNRPQDVITELERIKKLEQRLTESDAERDILREIDGLKKLVKVLKDKSTPELLRELQEKFADAPGLIDAKKLQNDVSLFYLVKITVLD